MGTDSVGGQSAAMFSTHDVYALPQSPGVSSFLDLLTPEALQVPARQFRRHGHQGVSPGRDVAAGERRFLRQYEDLTPAPVNPRQPPSQSRSDMRLEDGSVLLASAGVSDTGSFLRSCSIRMAGRLRASLALFGGFRLCLRPVRLGLGGFPLCLGGFELGLGGGGGDPGTGYFTTAPGGPLSQAQLDQLLADERNGVGTENLNPNRPVTLEDLAAYDAATGYVTTAPGGRFTPEEIRRRFPELFPNAGGETAATPGQGTAPADGGSGLTPFSAQDLAAAEALQTAVVTGEVGTVASPADLLGSAVQGTATAEAGSVQETRPAPPSFERPSS